MNTKDIVLGVAATALGFGIGIGIPLATNAKFEITSFDQAQDILNKASAAELENLEKSTAETSISTEDDNSINEQVQEHTKNTSDAEPDSLEEALTKNMDSSVENGQSGGIIDVSFDVESWEINGVPLIGSSYDKMLKTVELDSTGTGYIWNGEHIALRAVSASGESIYLQEDGTYINMNNTVFEPERKLLEFITKNRYACEYIYNCNDGYASFNILSSGDYSQANADAEEISSYSNLPFIYGTYDDMNAVFHTDEIIAKGEKKEQKSSGLDRFIYEAKTSDGEAIRLVTSDYGDRIEYEYRINEISVLITFNVEKSDYSNDVRYTSLLVE